MGQALLAFEKANQRTIAAALSAIAVKSIYGKAAIAAALALLGVQ